MPRLPRTLEEFEGAMWERLGDSVQLKMTTPEFDRLNLLLGFAGKPAMVADRMIFCGQSVMVLDTNQNLAYNERS